MIRDVGAIVWKEAHELWHTGSGRGGRITLILLLLAFGVFWPWQFGLSIGTAAVWLWLPMMLIGQAVIDSFAGERERHTLDTLLASRLSATAIVLGKLAAAVAYGSLFAVLTVVVATITASVTSPGGRSPTEQQLPVERIGPVATLDLRVLLAAAGFFVLVALLVAAIAAIVSMKSTVRQGSQAFAVAIAVVSLLPVVVAASLPPEIANSFKPFAERLGTAGQVALVVGSLVLFDAVAIAACLTRFRRSDLVLG